LVRELIAAALSLVSSTPPAESNNRSPGTEQSGRGFFVSGVNGCLNGSPPCAHPIPGMLAIGLIGDGLIAEAA